MMNKMARRNSKLKTKHGLTLYGIQEEYMRGKVKAYSSMRIKKELAYFISFFIGFLIFISLFQPISTVILDSMEQTEKKPDNLIGSISSDLSTADYAMELEFQWLTKGTSRYFFKNENVMGETLEGQVLHHEDILLSGNLEEDCCVINEVVPVFKAIGIDYEKQEGLIHFFYQRKFFDANFAQKHDALWRIEAKLCLTYNIMDTSYSLTRYSMALNTLTYTKVNATYQENIGNGLNFLK